ncbi:hypothetical protein HY384_02860 [Candidatus Daviesbacteria bacterium]|nr:hypothetical protein [Candidatus Daviesbacteria bacterium]
MADVPAEDTAEEAIIRRLDIFNALDCLTPWQKRVIVLKFGLEDGIQRTLGEVAKECGWKTS